jgi:hypothetical protein
MLAASPVTASDLCAGLQRPDTGAVHIEESEITVDAAREALAYLAQHPPPSDHMLFASITVLRGYVLKREAELFAPDSAQRKRYCQWLRDEAYYPE